MTSPNQTSLSLGLFSDRPGALIYTGFATIAAAALLFVALNRKNSNHSTPSPGKARSVPRTGKMSPQPGSVKVSKILIHPIKSCRGTSVQSARYTPEGVENDRLWCVIDEKLDVVTAREAPKLVLIAPRIEIDESSPDGGLLVVTFPEDSGCATFQIPLRPSEKTLSTWKMLTDIIIWSVPVDGYICQSVNGAPSSPSDILSKYLGKKVHLVYKGPQPRSVDKTYEFPELKATVKYQDGYPLMVFSEENVKAVEEKIRPLVGTQGIDRRWEDGRVLIERFRPNIVFKGAGAFGEDQWEEISIGSKDAPAITLVSKCTRCLLPNVDPETGLKDAAVPYKVTMKFRKGLDPIEKMKPCLGCNAVPWGSGTVNVGDDVYVKKMW